MGLKLDYCPCFEHLASADEDPGALGPIHYQTHSKRELKLLSKLLVSVSLFPNKNYVTNNLAAHSDALIPSMSDNWDFPLTDWQGSVLCPSPTLPLLHRGGTLAAHGQ